MPENAYLDLNVGYSVLVSSCQAEYPVFDFQRCRISGEIGTGTVTTYKYFMIFYSLGLLH